MVLAAYQWPRTAGHTFTTTGRQLLATHHWPPTTDRPPLGAHNYCRYYCRRYDDNDDLYYDYYDSEHGCEYEHEHDYGEDFHTYYRDYHCYHCYHDDDDDHDYYWPLIARRMQLTACSWPPTGGRLIRPVLTAYD